MKLTISYGECSMKILSGVVMKFAFLTTLILFTTQFSVAAEPPATTEQRDSPCIKVMDACKIAGYNKSSVTDKKSLSKDCIQPLLNGQKVEGVSVNQSDVDACKTKKNELKQKIETKK